MAHAKRWARGRLPAHRLRISASKQIRQSCASPSATGRVVGRADPRSVCPSPATREHPSERLFVAHIAKRSCPSNTAELAEAGA